MTKQERINELEAENKRLTDVLSKSREENYLLKEKLSDALWPVDAALEEMEQTILRATKIFSDRLRELRKPATEEN